MDTKIQKLKEYINRYVNIVFFGGAGVSTESGILDFRSANGLYNQKYRYSPEYMLSHTFFEKHTLVVYPAAGLVQYFKGDKIVIINREPTKIDNNADLFISCGIGKVFESIMKAD